MSTVTRYEIVNTYGPFSISSSSMLHAAAAIILLGEGTFALRTLSPLVRVVCPPFALSGENGLKLWWSQQEWKGRRIQVPFFEWVKREGRGIADALDSIEPEPGHAAVPEADLRTLAKPLIAELRRAKDPNA